MTEVAVLNQTDVAPEPKSESATLINIIQRAASDPSVDIAKMERLFEMHERMENRRSIEAFNSAMANAQAEMPAVVKNQLNSHTNKKYADLFAIADKAMPQIYKNGFGLSFSECAATKENCIGVACLVTHSAGHSVRYEFNVPLDKAGSAGKTNKTDVQAYGSTMTYGRRYATCNVFNIQVTDNDGAAEVTMITEAEAQNLLALLSSDYQDLPGFCNFFGIQKVADLPAEKFSTAMTMIERRKAALTRGDSA